MIHWERIAEIPVTCQSCKRDFSEFKSVYFQGIHLLGIHNCGGCGAQFYQTLPVAHDALFPIQLTKDLKSAFFPDKAKAWLANPLVNSLKDGAGIAVQLQVEKRREFSKIILVNVLDSCFGHVITKLWNAYTLATRQPDWGLAILIPETCAWMVPEETAELWKVPLPLKDTGKHLLGLDRQIKDLISNYEQVAISEVRVHLDASQIDHAKMFKMKRFELAQFSSLPLKVTFVLREDRLWLRSRFLQLLHLASVKFGFQKQVRPILIGRQCGLINRLVKMIQREVPETDFAAVGIGKSGRLSPSIDDRRCEKPDGSSEIEWNARYAQSHLVVGVHGSGMMIPTALAAGFVNILPAYKIDHIVEDTLLPYTNRLLTFLGRFVDESASPRLISQHVLSIYREFPYVYNNLMQEPE